MAVHGDALDDADFVGGRDEVALRVDLGSGKPPFMVEADALPAHWLWLGRKHGEDGWQRAASLRARIPRRNPRRVRKTGAR